MFFRGTNFRGSLHYINELFQLNFLGELRHYLPNRTDFVDNAS